MQIREAGNNDLEQLAALFNGYRVFYRKESELEAARNFLSERFENGDSKIYVCDMGAGQLAGFVQLYPLFSSTRMRKAWLLNDLFVDGAFRGKGISVQLIERAKQLVRESEAFGMFLETEKSNAIGNSLYPRTGFQLNEASNYYEWTA